MAVTAVLLLHTAGAQRKVITPNRGKKEVKDSIVIGCIITGQTIAPDDGVLDALGEKELKMVVSSPTDTTVLSPWDLVVSSVRRMEDGTYELVASHQDYWFWFSGIGKTRSYKGQVLKKGDKIGVQETGQKIELLVYDFETPVDPKLFQRCAN
ncbi:MAG: hypothetical protein EOO09_16500 [Chitinophagaceae bacterium]|nr:MAG: hypothetical protein EOO09_16500 [Chitinophagaceae bacterium]